MTAIDSAGVRVLFPGPLTNAEYFALPETNLRMELFEGKVMMSPSPTADHQDLIGELYTALREYARRSGGRAFVAALDVELREKLVLQPDVLYIAPDGAARISDHVYGPPDIVVEVLSPGTRRYDLEDKQPRYAEAGVREYWTIDPESKSVTVLANEKGNFQPLGTAAFGEEIPSAIADVGDGGLRAFAD